MADQQELLLSEATSHHLLRVLRAKPGTQLILFDGSGMQCLAELLSSERKLARVRLLDQQWPQVESPLWTQLALAISKGDRVDIAVQKAVELGVSSIQPLATERSELRLTPDRQAKKQHHWQQIADSACEQSGRVRRVEVLTPLTLEQWLRDLPILAVGELRLVLHPRAAQPLASHQRPERLCLMVGPEGGFSDAEIDLACQYQFHSTLIGPRVLRTETAPIVALSLAQSLWGDF